MPARTGICEPDETLTWMKNSMPNLSIENMRNNAVIPDKDAHYDGGIHIINHQRPNQWLLTRVTQTKVYRVTQPMALRS